MGEFINVLGAVEYFTKLNSYFGRWRIKILQEHRPKTDFVCHARKLQCTLMQFGLTNETVCFQRALGPILAKYKWKTYLIYLEDVIIFFNNVDHHMKCVNDILITLADSGGTLKIAKCHLFERKAEYLGKMVKLDRLEMDKTNVE